MIEVLLAIVALALLAMFGTLIDIAASLRGIRRRFEKHEPPINPWRHFFPPPRHYVPPIHLPILSQRIAMWIFEENRWVLQRRCGQPDCRCEPPKEKGQYEKEVVRNECPARD